MTTSGMKWKRDELGRYASGPWTISKEKGMRACWLVCREGTGDTFVVRSLSEAKAEEAGK